jgi:hypothetical protein
MIYPSRLILSSWIVVARRHQDEARGRQVSIDAILLQPAFLHQVSWATYEAACVVCACVRQHIRLMIRGRSPVDVVRHPLLQHLLLDRRDLDDLEMTPATTPLAASLSALACRPPTNTRGAREGG